MIVTAFHNLQDGHDSLMLGMGWAGEGFDTKDIRCEIQSKVSKLVSTYFISILVQLIV